MKAMVRPLLAVVAALQLVSGCSDPVEWATKAVQVERMDPSDGWMVSSTLRLDKPRLIDGNQAGAPTIEVELVAAQHSPVNDRLRRLTARCPGSARSDLTILLDSSNTQRGWQTTMQCQDEAWRMTIVKYQERGDLVAGANE